MARVLWALLGAFVCAAAPGIDTGELNGAQFRIEMPQNRMLAVHTAYDQLVRPYVPGEYALLAAQNGSAGTFTRQYVIPAGHRSILPAGIARASGVLREWKRTGKRPAGGARQ